MFNMKINKKYLDQFAILNSRNIMIFKFSRHLIPFTLKKLEN